MLTPQTKLGEITPRTEGSEGSESDPIELDMESLENFAPPKPSKKSDDLDLGSSDELVDVVDPNSDDDGSDD